VLLLGSRPAAAGEIVRAAIPSPALKRTIPVSIYRPTPTPLAGERWPVLYLLHGLGDDETAWPTLGRVRETLDALIAAGAIKPMMVVMPGAGRSWYVDNPDSGGDGAMAAALSRDLPEAIDRSHPTLACRGGRAVGGLSMGGYGALLYALDRPRSFAAAFSLSGSLFPPMPTDPADRVGRATAMFGAAFGAPFDGERFNRWNLFLKLPAYAADPERTPFYLTVGDRDLPRLIEANAAFRAALAEHGLSAAFRVDPGGHEWSLWARQLGPALIWADRHLGTSCLPG
jgi:S-formylglutathione hydrolase FrmB